MVHNLFLRFYSSFITVALVFFVTSSCTGLKSFKDISVKGVKPEKNIFRMAWSKNIDPPYSSGNLPISLHYPHIYRGILYVGDNSGYFKALELKSGNEIWREYDASTYLSGATIYKDTVLYGTSQGDLISRNRLTGKLNYKVHLGSAVETDLSIYKAMAFIQLRNHKLVALDVSTGKILWAYQRSVPYLTTVQRASKPLVKDNKIYIGFADGMVCAFRTQDGVILWEKKISEGTKFIDVDMTPVYYKSSLLVGSLAGSLYRLDPKTGKTLQKLPYILSRSPIIYRSWIVLGTINGELVFLDSNYREYKRLKVADEAISSIAQWKGRLVVGTVGQRVFGLDRQSLEVKDKMNLGHHTSAIFGKIATEDNFLALLSSRNRLYVFQ